MTDEQKPYETEEELPAKEQGDERRLADGWDSDETEPEGGDPNATEPELEAGLPFRPIGELYD